MSVLNFFVILPQKTKLYILILKSHIMELTQLKGIMTRLEFKAMLHLTGLQRTDLIDVIRMNEAQYFLIGYKKGGGTYGTLHLYFDDINEVIKNHSKSLMIK